MRFAKISFLSFLCVAVFPFTQVQAKCGINSISTQRCEEGGWRTVVTCHDRVRRTMENPPGPCRTERRYSASRQVMRSFCENRCNPPILDCSLEPSLFDLMEAICEKVVECRPDFFDNMVACHQALENISASDELGLAEGRGEITFRVIENFIDENTNADPSIRFDRDVYCDCIHRIRNLSSCPDVSDAAFGEGYVEELIPEECGNDQYPGTIIPDGFNPVTGQVEN